MRASYAQFHTHQQIQICCVTLGKSLPFPWQFLHLQNADALPHKGITQCNKLKMLQIQNAIALLKTAIKKIRRKLRQLLWN